MKKTTQIFFVIALLMTSGITAFAQTDMKWDTHGIGFTIPARFKTEVNNKNEFSGSTKDIFLKISPFQDANVNLDDMSDAIVQIASDLKYDDLRGFGEIDLDDLKGYYVVGTKDGVNAVVMCMIDVKSSTNLLVVIGFNDGHEREALDIAASFYPYD